MIEILGVAASRCSTKKDGRFPLLAVLSYTMRADICQRSLIFANICRRCEKNNNSNIEDKQLC